MNVKIHDLMVPSVVTVRRTETSGRVKLLMKERGIHSVPVVDDEGRPVGIVSASDLLEEEFDSTPLSQIMTRKVLTVPQYDDVSVAARVMRNHEIHHVVVTHEQKIVGILSAFDLLQLVEEHRFVMKNPPTPPRRASKRG